VYQLLVVAQAATMWLWRRTRTFFDTILKSMKKSTLAMVVTQTLPIVAISQDPEDMLVVAQKFAQKEKFS